MSAMLFLSQAYLTTATGNLAALSDISELDSVEKVRYYKISNFEVDQHYGGGTYTDFRTSGKFNQDLHFDIYFVTPIVSDTSKLITAIPKHWYGVKYQEQISNRISEEEKEEKYQAFYNDCLQKMMKYNFYTLDHFKRTPTSDDRQNFLKAIEARTGQAAGEQYVVLEPIQDKYENRNGTKFAWIFGTYAIGLVVLLFSLIWPGYSESERERFLQGKKPEQDDIVDMINYLIPRGEHFVTSIILDLNIVVFAAMIFSGVDVISPNGLELLEWGANRRYETTGGQWWRLITSMFLHGGVMHLIMNIGGLVIAAIFVEPMFKRGNYLMLYLISGLCGSLASVWWYTNTISVGASGAIFGLYGATLGLTITKAIPKDIRKIFLGIAGIFIVINLLWGLAVEGIDNAAHLGGLLSGAIIAVLLFKPDDVKENIFE